ncbi:MAG: rRNA pseudouridine synthase [Deltaproteobacteria bacterium]|nr:rRNA pseudouridine synthase [Deltaproteobacteria bacterium]
MADGPPRLGWPAGHVPLERALSKLGLASRTQARAWIGEGRVTVGGAVVRDPDLPVVPERIQVQIDQAPVAQNTPILLAYNKPRGLLVTRDDPQGRPTIYSELGAKADGVQAVGRLDQATSGLLLLTNDTQLANRLLDPRSQVRRRYLVEVKGLVSPELPARLVQGVVDDGERLAADAVEIKKVSRRESQLLLDLSEGKNREVRRLLAACGHPVQRLLRIAYGPIGLGTLQPGQVRVEDIEAVRRWLSLPPASRPSA